MKSKKNKLMNYPKIEPTKENSLVYLFDLYKALGWNGTDLLDPYEIKLNQEQWHEICKLLVQLRDEKHNPALTWMNQGPTVSTEVPYGKVMVGAKAFTEWTEE